jgi:hypothetical protein
MFKKYVTTGVYIAKPICKDAPLLVAFANNDLEYVAHSNQYSK